MREQNIIYNTKKSTVIFYQLDVLSNFKTTFHNLETTA